MKTIRFWTSYRNTDPAFWSKWLNLDETRYRLVYDAEAPDYLIVTPHVYTSDVVRNEFVRKYRDACVSVFFATECAFPDMNLFDYAVAFDRGLELDGRIIRCTTRSFDPLGDPWASDLGCVDPVGELSRKTGFCNFIYSNGHAHPHRDWMFHMLSTYRRVDSLGIHLNNCGNVPSRVDQNWRRLLVEQKRSYKFSIAAENAACPGYTTEKLITSFMAHTVPIYWGDPSVAEEFNERAFVNANGLSEKELIDRVRELDSDDDKYRAMLAEPPMTAEQCRVADEQERRYRAFTNGIFAVPPAVAKRAPLGTWTDNYKRWALAPVASQYDTVARCGRYALIRDAKRRVLGPPGAF